MFDNIGQKIKTLAMVVCWIGIIGSTATGLVLIGRGIDGPDVLVTSGVITVIFGPFLSWIGSFFMYGFGQLIDDTQKLREHIVPDEETVESEEDDDDYDYAGDHMAETTLSEIDFKVVPGANCLVCNRTGVPLAPFTNSDDGTPDGYICADCAAEFEKE